MSIIGCDLEANRSWRHLRLSANARKRFELVARLNGWRIQNTAQFSLSIDNGDGGMTDAAGKL